MRPIRSNRAGARRAFSLIEVVIAIIVLAIAVPPTLNMMESAGAGRVDAINTTRATLLATSVLETVTADVNSEAAGLGFDALGDAATYLNDPGSGLYARLETSLAAYTDAGLSYSVDIGGLVAADGNPSGDADDNIFREVTVRVSFNAASSASYQVPFRTMVSAL
ncbi:MAG: prepilin-type N-terminal cleavage/methylation domain-containing protein [bacterium]|nr:prepilin-type N-terminal cleavage/methylation domain-containing protein [bacterium]